MGAGARGPCRTAGARSATAARSSLVGMCGRYLQVSTPDELAERLQIDEVRTEPQPPRWNVAPGTDVYAVVERDDARRLGTMWWGFFPPRMTRLKGTRLPINARVETLATNGMFARALQRRRCLLPADGFWEWQDRGDGRRKQPYHLADPDGEPLVFAAIFSSWRDPEAGEDAAPRFGAAIVTTAARGEMARIHDRMPVMLPRGLWSAWLADGDDTAPHLLEAIAALGPPRLVATPVTGRVNSSRNDGPELLEPGTIDDPPD